MTGKELKDLRSKAKLTQAAAAEKIGLSRTAYLRLEQAETVNTKYADKLAALFKTDVSDLTKASEKTTENTDTKPTEKAAAKTTKARTSKKAPAKKKSSAKKTTVSKAKTSASEKSPVVKSTKQASSVNPASQVKIELQYAGKSISYDDILAAAKKYAGKDGSLNLYIKPEENRVYYVNDKTTGSFEI